MAETASGSPFTCEICILAGGLSRRMGRDKTRLRLGPTTMAGHIRATARRTGWPVRVIRRDLVPRCGPVGGVYTGLKTTRADAVFFLACDMPFVGVEVLDRLLEEYRSIPHAAFTMHHGLVGFPFILPRSSLDAVVRQLERQEFSLKGLANSLRARTIQIPQKLRPQLRNINTPSEWERARTLWSMRKSKR